MKIKFSKLHLQICFISLLLIIGVLYSAHYIGLLQSISGTLLGLIFFSVSYTFKFLEPEDEQEEKGHGSILMFQLIIIIIVSDVWYSSINLYYNGAEKHGVIIKEVKGFKESGIVGSHHYYVIADYYRKVALNRYYKVGDTVKYISMLADDKLHGENSDNFIIMEKNSNRFETILTHRGYFFYSSVVYGSCLFTTWFISLFKQGKTLLKVKLSSCTTRSTKIVFSTFYYLSYITFILFVLAIFKNIYNIVPFKLLNITLITLSLVVILITSLGEDLFRASTNVMLDLKSYNALVWAKHIVKVVGYLSFALLLYKSITTTEKSVFDLLFEFLSEHFDIDVKSVFK